MNELQAQVDQLNADIAMERARGNFPDADRKAEEVARLLAQMDELNKQVMIAAVTAEVQSPNSDFGISVQGYTVNFREITENEESYQALTIAVKIKLQEIEDDNQAELNAIRESYEAQAKTDREYAQSISDELDLVRNDLHDVRSKLEAANHIITDIETEKASADKEVESLKKTVEDLRNQVSKPAVANNLDNNSLKEAMEKLKQSRPAIYEVVEIDGRTTQAKLLETDEVITFSPYYIGKYRIADQAEVQRFREEAHQAQQYALESIPEVAATAEPVDFPLQAPELSDTTVPEHSADGEVAATAIEDAVTRAEFEELKGRVDVLFANKKFAETAYKDAS